MAPKHSANRFLIRYVESYKRATELLLPEWERDKSTLHFAITQMSGQALELAFKHFLFMVDGNFERSHNLLDLYENSKRAGLRANPSRMLTQGELESLNAAYYQVPGNQERFASRYPNAFVETGGMGGPSVERTLRTVDEVVAQANG